MQSPLPAEQPPLVAESDTVIELYPSKKLLVTVQDAFAVELAESVTCHSYIVFKVFAGDAVVPVSDTYTVCEVAPEVIVPEPDVTLHE